MIYSNGIRGLNRNISCKENKNKYKLKEKNLLLGSKLADLAH